MAAGDSSIVSVSKEELKRVFLVNTLPFIGFGLLDNMIMIFAGRIDRCHDGPALWNFHHGRRRTR